ncbi:hypothetical protein CC1G_06072 [Coprinopsis cinerea okayama7|uniref:Beta-glucuronidase C-terminal domain-containing protein n=1 Tax=Coprinopsis cinerea (strain Okayama-7 / 130 / ATCC MYA-4618 / FGSC 9003) TaxID=240176 RepID=A8PA18_COPC7|nr:hypothetical protein CC1G_06072 [Coprinopsis cinerea okayama7\|eukprot:XP_001839882.2 hypothetical protein CC1G_06072 [Coprinopsis cinerea okayama7\
MPTRLWLLGILAYTLTASASVTVYYLPGQEPLFSPGASTTSGAAATYTGAAAYNPTVLEPPPPPNPPITKRFALQLRNGGTPGVSIQQSGAFFGFSIEMSVVNQVLGKNSTVLMVPFLNLMSNLIRRGGSVRVRVGGNTQETAVLVPSLPDGRILSKDEDGLSNPTQTPPLDYTADLIYMLGNISSLVNVDWFLGVPFMDASNFQLAIAEVGQQVLGSRLIGLQAGNEPDLYKRHGHRDENYGPDDYFDEFRRLVDAMSGDAHVTNKHILVGPSIASGDWTPEMVWDTGFVDQFSDNLAFLSVEHYPSDNCYAQFGVGTPRDPQEMFENYLNHESGVNTLARYLDATAYAQAKGKSMLMFETNTASCGGFAGISDSFGAALWALDYSMQMAHSNFSGAMFHIGGQNVFYNPFTPPPTNQTAYHQWTIGPVYYSALVMAEALGPSGKAQVLDLAANNRSTYTPAYGIYEDGNPVRVLLINFIDDPSGANDVTVSISVGGGHTGQPNASPSQVRVKYLSASSVSQKGNFTWAGQTFGANFESDGRLQGDEDTLTVSCDGTTNVCSIKVPAPGAALVFLTDNSLDEVEDNPVQTFATSVRTRMFNTATVDPAVLATSNGHGAFSKKHLGSTSKGSTGSGAARRAVQVDFWLVVGVSFSFALWSFV